MVQDLNMDLELVVCPIVREEDGLALSSRNARLTAEQRLAAPVLHRALSTARAALEAGEREGNTLRALMRAAVNAEPLAELDYVSAADPWTLEELDRVEEEVLLSLAVFLGGVRLIDNMLVKPGE